MRLQRTTYQSKIRLSTHIASCIAALVPSTVDGQQEGGARSLASGGIQQCRDRNDAGASWTISSHTVALYLQEDVLLRRLIKEHGVKKWSSVAEGIPGRSGKSCRLRSEPIVNTACLFLSRLPHSCTACFRWYNQLCPHLKKESFSQDEDSTIIKASFTLTC